MNNSLIKSADDYIEASSAYLDYCVDKEDFCPTDKHFDSLRKIVFDRGKASEIVRLGYGYIHRKDFGNSEKCFKFVLDINPKHAHAFNGLGSVFIELGKRKENENRKEESKADFIKAVRYFEDSRNIKSLAITHRNLGYAYSLLKDYKSAEQEYRKSLQLEEGSVVTHNLLGYLLIEKFDPDGAEIELKRAIEIDPYYVPARHNLGILFSKSGNYKGAIEEFDKALKINDSHVGVYISRGIALLRQEKFDEAKSSFIKAIEINFDSGVAHYHLGLLLSHSGEKPEAMEEYRIAVKKARTILKHGLL